MNTRVYNYRPQPAGDIQVVSYYRTDGSYDKKISLWYWGDVKRLQAVENVFDGTDFTCNWKIWSFTLISHSMKLQGEFSFLTLLADS